MSKFDTIVIGSGLGGLSAASYLAKNGKKVLVLEQHSLIGGCATCFKRKDMLIDAGLHEMDWGNPKTDMKEIVFKKLGLMEKIELIPLPSAWSILSKDFHLQIPHGEEEVKKTLIRLFPHEEKGIEKYFKAIKLQAYSARRFAWDMNKFELFFFPFTTAWIFLKNKLLNLKVSDVLNSIIKDDKLKKILNINIGYYHHDPKKFIWSFHAISQKHYYDGAVYVKGGSGALSKTFEELVRENNGEVKSKCDVVEILTSNSKAIGVRYKQNRKFFEVYADNIIANCDPEIVYNDLLKNKNLDLTLDVKKIENKNRACSLISAYFIYDRNISEIYPNMDYANFILDKEFFDASFDNSNTLDFEISKRTLAFVNYSKIDNGLSQRDDRFLGVAAISSHFKEWDLNEKEYRVKKEEILQAIISKLDEYFPNLSSYMIHSELATPKSILRYTRAKEGTAYGFSQDKEGRAYRLNYVSKTVKNLFFASAFTFPGGGFTGAILGGYYTASKMLCKS
ncbi:phytoene desaturase family protein [Campylobacter aviculae]|uniref:NAD(P)/FAD-dependent oxidoreductase n=1 Tax=Campylobacter aviculae TaxID=2510190 RepID=A0A4U7BM27_9BACT|nr:NAD(P)/FAD-dependent oxidoreductase [Campylobacter aviculae]TKX32759.1 NAD(P)/FAD-dependent oxidoreductase [Campylobacter aviculae]